MDPKKFQTPYAVIFTSKLKTKSKAYEEMASKMFSLAQEQKGFLGIESAREDIGITVSYWKDLESIKTWKENAAHQIAQELGRNKWYAAYKVRIAKVERQYDF
ncbi:antibiotic biosynthesis monooxygenase [Mesonia sp.]|uniref:antibiotic biosynthesis monooxygenase family protein n=1 Tax=Mesonia sp. TaxID=1960830 RepID=UPI00176F28AB|nr:antibiotic biosynthesis monooxygenase [Mesonia sp.]HIB37143.1 antibiotic biosynthesis monooxygenase [Mesonia sp.]HIO26437.1 antibiotic biosynthesis monooxygenase [Flavobacteriaceae bacterium]